jgi:hypothetical protein
LENFEEIDKFLDTYDHPKLNLEDISHLKRSITHNEIETSIKSLPKQKVQILNCILPDLQRMLSFSQNTKEGTLPNSFYEDNITLIPKPEKDTSKNENYTPISLINIKAKILNKIMAKPIQQYIRKIIHHDQVGFIPVMQGCFNIHESINIIQQPNRSKDENNLIIS